MTSDIASSVREYLDSKGMSVTQDWLTECIEYFRNEGRNVASKDLLGMVESQWLLGDLRDISPGRLPPDLNQQHKSTLEGVHTLQMDHLLDVGVPVYQQILKLQKVDRTNIELTTEYATKDPPPQRMIKLTLTDGVQEIHAIEYRPMRNLNLSLIPGTKIQVKGPVLCRRGVLMLEEKHISVLGGEVEDLIEANNYKNILIKKLAEENGTSVENITRTITPRQNIRDTNNVHVQVHTDDVKKEELFADDNIDLSELEAIENQVLSSENARTSPTVNPITEAVPEQMHDSFDDEDFQDYFREPTLELPPPPANISNPTKYEDESCTKNFNQVQSKRESSFPSDESPSTSKRIKIENNESDAVKIEKLLKTSSYLKQSKVLRVKARIEKVIGKLSLQKTVWTLRCTIVDDTGSMDVDVHNDVLSRLIGYTPEEVTKMKKRMATKPELKGILVQALEKAMNDFTDLDCPFLISHVEGVPWISGIER